MPVWMLVPFIPDWRWLSVGEWSHWYPTMRIFRQRRNRIGTVLPLTLKKHFAKSCSSLGSHVWSWKRRQC